MTKSQPTKCISALLAEVRVARRQAEKEASEAGDGNYMKRLSSVVEGHITTEEGRGQLIWIACAAELGVLELAHLQLNRHAREALNERALSALFWAVVRRWNRSQAERPGLKGHAIPQKIDGEPCLDCSDPYLDRRRYTPHRWLERDGLDGSLQAHSDLAIRFRCLRCETHWVRRLLNSEYFAGWSITRFGMGLQKVKASTPGESASKSVTLGVYADLASSKAKNLYGVHRLQRTGLRGTDLNPRPHPSPS